MGFRTLGLDLGANSIGWSLVADDRIVAAGVRVFPEGVDNFDTRKEKPKMSRPHSCPNSQVETRSRI